MIKTLKLRNLVFFICIIVVASSIGASLAFWSVATGQQAAADGKKDTIELLNKKLSEYSDLSNFLTIKDQLGNLNQIGQRKQVLSRTFNILSTLIPTGPDSITVSALSINLAGEAPTFTFDAQADARTAPYIDYNVLDSFKKSMQYMRYDYGDYVDRNGAKIPAYCIIETANDGSTFYDANKQSYYAYWLITGEGCNPSNEPLTREENTETIETTDTSSDTQTQTQTNQGGGNTTTTTTTTTVTTTTITVYGEIVPEGYDYEFYNGQVVAKIWRTPQYKEWYQRTNMNNSQSSNQDVGSQNQSGQSQSNPNLPAPSMTADGTISNVAHFESSCIKYQITEDSNGNINWTETDDCKLVADDGIKITDSSNGRDASDQLVLRFSAVITLNPEIYKFTNHHVLGIAPSGRRNVTDSYTQVQKLFAERAVDCAEDDITCQNNTRNISGGNE